jgi:hypothetical protein
MPRWRRVSTDKADLYKFKGMILGSVEASFFTFDQLRMISDFVSQRGGGFLMLGGKNSFGQGGYVNTPIEDMLPVQLSQSARGIPEFSELEYKVRLTSAAPNTSPDYPLRRRQPERWMLQPRRQANGSQVAALLAQEARPTQKDTALQSSLSSTLGRKSVASDSHHVAFEMGRSIQQFSDFSETMLRWLVSDAPVRKCRAEGPPAPDEYIDPCGRNDPLSHPCRSKPLPDR